MMGDCMCKRCHGVYKIVFGALLLLNVFVWPRWGIGANLSNADIVAGWVGWLAVLMVLGGALKLLVPNKCPGCAQMCGPMAAVGKGKR
ncbi:MAG TPA: hypothetical protein VJI32_05045 [Candidatus Nanoarchaeia archaeon]|nr:hypothetical protein [Candidatus Nanoarchaeia archaeon]